MQRLSNTLALALMFCVITAPAQQLSPRLIAAAGTAMPALSGNARLSFSVGEAAISVLNLPTVSCAQGFHNGVLSPVVATGELDLGEWNVHIAPNPVSQTLHLHFTAPEPGDYLEVAVWNLLGQPLGPVTRMDALAEKTLDVTHLPIGIYLLHLSDRERRSSSLRFVKIK